MDKESLIVEARDFQTTGIVSTARGCPFYILESRTYVIQGRRVVVKKDYLENCRGTIKEITNKID